MTNEMYVKVKDVVRHIAKMRVSPCVLVDALHMPSGTDVLYAEYDFESGSVVLFVEHPDLKPVNQGGEIPYISPMIRRQEPVVFDWNQ